MTSQTNRTSGPGPTVHRFTEERVRAQCHAVLRAWGFSIAVADTASRVMADTDLSGVDSHGVSMLASYEQAVRTGGMDTAAEPTVERENGPTALVDARGGLGHPAAVTGMELATAKARHHGVGAVSVVNSAHFGAAGYYSAMAAHVGLVGLVTTSARTVAVVPTDGAHPRLPTNPLSFAAPVRGRDPFVLDMSTSTAAINRIKVRALNDRPLPEGWFLDDDGVPVTDADRALRSARSGEGGGLTPLGGTYETGGHKGYGLSLMVQVLSAVLAGGGLPGTTSAGRGAHDVAHFLLALDPTFFRADGGFPDDMDRLITTMHDTPPAEDGGEVLVAGEPESRERERRREHGIPLPTTLLRGTQEICDRAGASFLLTPDEATGQGPVPAR